VNNFSISDLLIIDIETVPNVPRFEDLSPEWRLLWSDKISKTMPENTTIEDMYLLKAGILSEFAKIICISTAYLYYNEKKEISLRVKSIYGDDEADILKRFNELICRFEDVHKNFCFAGHNIKEFDIPFIGRRMLINGIALPQCLKLQGAKPWEVRMVDTLQWWRFGDYKNYITLNLLAHVLNVPTSKTDMDGSMVQDVYYKDKDLNRIVTYCQKDVEVVANILLRFENLPIVDGENVVVVE
jgi:DNA polymerase elongation subunit (family B)